MRTFFCLLFLLVYGIAAAQHFQPVQEVKLLQAIVHATAESADADNDGLPDIVLFTRSIDHVWQIKFLKGDTVNGFTPLHDSTTLTIGQYSSYSIVDYDSDNDLDLVLFGDSSLWINNGNFDFSHEQIAVPSLTISKWLDLDNNGTLEIFGSYNQSGEWITGVFLRENNVWKQQSDTLDVDLQAIEVVDADNNGYQDFFISGRFGADSLFSGFMLNNGDFELTPYQQNSWAGQTASGDLNNDGIFDVALAGVDLSGQPVHKFFLSRNGSFVVRDSVQQVIDASVFIADFDSDGVDDISFSGRDNNLDSIHTFQFAAGGSESFTSQFLQSYRYSDVEHDGDLDLLCISKPDSIHIVIYENQSPENQGPSTPAYAIANKIFDRFFFFWAPSVDDHTVSESLSYDLLVETGQMTQSSNYDILTERRLVTAHGNTLTHNFKLFDSLPADPSLFAVQAVDNSMHAATGGGGICIGRVCLLLQSNATVLEVCPQEIVSLTSPANSLWFSFKNGYEGTFAHFDYLATSSDTLFYYDPAVSDCSALTAFVIKVRDINSLESFIRYACEGDVISLGVETNWTSVQWTSLSQGFMGTSDSIQYTVLGQDTLSVQLGRPGCDVTRETAIIISKPNVSVADEELFVMKGNSVKLNASGAENYTWSPAWNLSNAAVANPEASPTENTTYVVTGYDSLHCESSASVRVIVENTGFLPGLFTPNDDGANDLLRIYGLREVVEFTFTILNREGKTVFESENHREVLNRGWDGMKGGVKQPSGVYFWKVIGTHPSGEQVRLNGKTEGSIILVR